MQHITGISRQQLQISSLENKIASDNPIRFIEAFVEHISLEALGFTVITIKSEGRPSFDTKLFHKPILPKCPCCKTGNLHRIAVFDQRGPPPEVSGWYLSDSQSSSPCIS